MGEMADDLERSGWDDGFLEDWHEARFEDEPPCGPAQWRTLDRDVVVEIAEMSDRHLTSCARLAHANSNHASRLDALKFEQARRDAGTL